MNKRSITSLSLGCASIISNLLLVLISSVPISVPLSVMGISFALASKEDVKLSKTAKAGLITSIIGLILGIVLFFVLISVFELLKDPEIVAQLEIYVKEILGSDANIDFYSLKNFYLH